MNITDYFPIGTKLIIEVVPSKSYDCSDCVFKKTGDCNYIKCISNYRKDNKNVQFKVVEVKEP